MVESLKFLATQVLLWLNHQFITEGVAHMVFDIASLLIVELRLASMKGANPSNFLPSFRALLCSRFGGQKLGLSFVPY